MDKKIIVVKVGSNVLTNQDGLPNLSIMKNLVDEISTLQKNNYQVILISSGAVAAGKSLNPIIKKQGAISQRQTLAAIGQIQLIQQYKNLFEEHKLICAQVLVTKNDFKDRHHYLNMRNCFLALLENRVIPIVNENDVVAVTELMFTDNDELAGLVAAMLKSESLIILSNVDGVYNKNPAEKDAQIIPIIREGEVNFKEIVSTQKSSFGRGGMITKCYNALKIAGLGVAVYIANGFKKNVLYDTIIKKNNTGTYFPSHKKASNIKTWVATNVEDKKAIVFINEGAKKALLSKQATSLLPIGIERFEGEFLKGDLLKIYTLKGEELGLGIARYGKKSALLKIGKSHEAPLIHYDYLLLHNTSL